MQDVTSDYHAILTAEESISSLDAALRLAVRIASGGDRSNGMRWHKIVGGKLAHTENGAGMTDGQRVAAVSQALGKIPQQIGRHFEQLPEDQYSLLMDTLLVVLHQAYFALLPITPHERERLLHIFADFAAHLPRAADQFQVRGLIALEQKKFDAAAMRFRAALSATHSDDHDFITRVQMIWTILMERNRLKEAFDCLLEIYRKASRNDLDDVEGMLRETFEAIQRRRRKSPVRIGRRN
jgi:hypothetical protein